jgi:MHS family proline/betaine transporter-like MFS transporter
MYPASLTIVAKSGHARYTVEAGGTDHEPGIGRSRWSCHAPPAIPTRPVIAASLIGNVMEWYDFAIYGYFAVVHRRQLLPCRRSYLVDAGRFCRVRCRLPCPSAGRRPVRACRRPDWAQAGADGLGDVDGMPTVLIGLLPTHAQIGALAGAALVFLRLLQGLAVGGEFTSSIAYAVEHAPAQIAADKVAGWW